MIQVCIGKRNRFHYPSSPLLLRQKNLVQYIQVECRCDKYMKCSMVPRSALAQRRRTYNDNKLWRISNCSATIWMGTLHLFMPAVDSADQSEQCVPQTGPTECPQRPGSPLSYPRCVPLNSRWRVPVQWSMRNLAADLSRLTQLGEETRQKLLDNSRGDVHHYPLASLPPAWHRLVFPTAGGASPVVSPLFTSSAPVVHSRY